MFINSLFVGPTMIFRAMDDGYTVYVSFHV